MDGSSSSMFHAVWKWLILPIVFVVTQPYAAFRYLALVLLVGANVAIIVTSSLPGLPTLISSLPPAALSFTLEFTRAWVSHRRADGHLSRQQMVLMGVALIVLCAQAIFMVFLAIQSDDRFAQASNLACVVHTICVEYGTRIRFLNRSLPSRGILCIVLFIQVPFLAAGAYLLFTSNLGIVWALVPILFLAYFVSLISIIQSRSDLKALMGDNLSSRRKETGYVLKNAAYATGICFLMSAAVLGVGVAFGWNALFSCEFFLVQAPCVHCIMHSTRESKEEDSSEAGITSSLRFVHDSNEDDVISLDELAFAELGDDESILTLTPTLTSPSPSCTDLSNDSSDGDKEMDIADCFIELAVYHAVRSSAKNC